MVIETEKGSYLKATIRNFLFGQPPRLRDKHVDLCAFIMLNYGGLAKDDNTNLFIILQLAREVFPDAWLYFYRNEIALNIGFTVTLRRR